MNLYDKANLLWYSVVAICLTMFGCVAMAGEYSIIKPITGYHYQDRNYQGKDWNENYWDSLGFGYRHESGYGLQAIYVNENSVNNESIFLHAEYMYNVNDWLSVGLAGGVRNGYGKKSENRSDSDFIPSGALQIETMYNNYGFLFQITDRVSVINYKYEF
jgi:predicted aminopeptidase